MFVFFIFSQCLREQEQSESRREGYNIREPFVFDDQICLLFFFVCLFFFCSLWQWQPDQRRTKSSFKAAGWSWLVFYCGSIQYCSFFINIAPVPANLLLDRHLSTRYDTILTCFFCFLYSLFFLSFCFVLLKNVRAGTHFLGRSPSRNAKVSWRYLRQPQKPK